jgi:hypothetical protein
MDSGTPDVVRRDVTSHVDSSSGSFDSGGGFDSTFGFDIFIPDSPVNNPDTTTGFDAGYDGGLVFFGNPGTPCTTLGQLQGQTCGRCGIQTSKCIARPDGGVPFDAGVDSGVDSGAHTEDGGLHDAALDVHATDAGEHDAGEHDAGEHDAGHDAEKDASTGLVWSEWGPCTSEIDGGCLPGTMMTQSCGICGTQTAICEPDCEMGVTNCEGQKVGGCVPGSTAFTLTAACTTDAGLGGRTQTCSATCSVEDAGACEAPPTTLVIASASGGKVDTFVNFTATQEDPLVGGGEAMLPAFCMPPGAPLGATQAPYGIVTVTNPSMTQAATISAWTSQVGMTQVDTAITVYAQMPTNTASLRNCMTMPGIVTDTCMDTSDPTSCLGSYGGLMVGDGNAVTIPKNSSVYIFVQDQFTGAGDIAPIELTIRTESFM